MFASDLVIDETLRNEKVAKYHLIKDVISDLSGKNVLEVGCGAGTFLRSLQQFNPKNTYYGYDTCAEAIQHARAFNDEVNYLDALTWMSGKFDVLFLVDVLEHTMNPCDFINGLSKYLKVGGTLILHVPLEKSGIYRVESLRNVKSAYSEHISFFDSTEVLQIVKGYGYQITKVHYHYHLISGLRDFLKYYMLYRKNYHGTVAQMYTKDWCNNILTSRIAKQAFYILDWLSYYETKLLSWLSFLSSGVTVVATKGKIHE